jgi:ferritin-like metal-binding protein YciE
MLKLRQGSCFPAPASNFAKPGISRMIDMGILIEDTTKFFYLTGLKNAHAMETQAVELLTRQAERLESYPEIEERLRSHLEESKQQRLRLEEVLHDLGESHSAAKEAVLGLGGNIAAMAHMAATDEIIKNTLANYMFEHFEIAVYESLGVMAEAAGDTSGVAAARTSLTEEKSMAQWIGDHIVPTTQKFLRLAAAGQTADH